MLADVLRRGGIVDYTDVLKVMLICPTAHCSVQAKFLAPLGVYLFYIIICVGIMRVLT